MAGWFLFMEPASDAREVAGPSTRAVPVETALARSGAAATLIRATGTLKASDSVVVQPEIAGRVVEVLLEQGQAVTAGTPLVKLETQTLQAELDRAECRAVLVDRELPAIGVAVAAWCDRGPVAGRGAGGVGDCRG